MGQSVSDKILSAVTGTHVETVTLTEEQMIKKIKELFYDRMDASGKDELKKVLKGSLIRDTKMTAPDGNFELTVSRGNHASIFNLSDRNIIHIFDRQETKFYEYKAYSLKNFDRMIKTEL
ncbi:MAG: hypothetical protein IKI75_11845 [Lachnospiraceae bacterium]|nr:hypothetical protein [Lachnospiraceae bacterium]